MLVHQDWAAWSMPATAVADYSSLNPAAGIVCKRAVQSYKRTCSVACTAGCFPCAAWDRAMDVMAVTGTSSAVKWV